MPAAQKGRRRRLMGEINVVPYIDVMLVLLIIFMITAPLLAEGVKVELPKAGAQPIPPEMLKDSKPIVLTIDDSRPAVPQLRRASRMNPSTPPRSKPGRPPCCAVRPRPPCWCAATTAWPMEK